MSTTDTDKDTDRQRRAVGDRRTAATHRRRRFARAGAVRPQPPVLTDGPITEGSPVSAVFDREFRSREALALADVVVALAIALVALPVVADSVPPLLALLGAPVLVLLNKMAGLYDRDDLVLKKTTLDEAPRLVQVSGVSILLLWFSIDTFAGEPPHGGRVLLLWGLTFLALLVARAMARRVAARVSTVERCLVIGDPEGIEAVRAKIQGARVNARVVGAIDLTQSRRPGELVGYVWASIQRFDAHRVVVCPPAGGSGDTVDLIRIAKHAGVHVSVVPRVFEVIGSAVEFDHLDGLTMLGVRRFGLSRSSRALKRAFDLVGSTIAIVALAPVMALIAAAIRAEGRGPILFSQTRVGRDGEHFEILKFRSMVPDAEERKDELRAFNEAEGLFKIAEDPRITRTGRILRKTSLDELPQLFCVWKGQMSLVGPRPLVVDEDSIVQGLDRQRLHLTPGMTGHWQILGSARIPLPEMLGIDYLYVANWSLWTDVKILLRTIPYVVASRGM